MNPEIPENLFVNKAVASVNITIPAFGQAIVWPSIEEVRRNTTYRPPIHPQSGIQPYQQQPIPIPAHAQATPQASLSGYGRHLNARIDFTWPMNATEREAFAARWVVNQRTLAQQDEIRRNSVAGRYSKEVRTKLANIKDKNPQQFKNLLKELGIELKEG